MKKKIKSKIWKISGDSNIYFLDLAKKIVIDAGNRADRNAVKMLLKDIIDPKEIEIVIFTHLHYDHTGNFDLFENAKFYAGKEEIKSFKEKPLRTVLHPIIANKLKSIELDPAKDMCGLKVIDCPGHTAGSIALWYEKEKILFSGDTLFFRGLTGRLDLPTNDAKKMDETLQRLEELDYETLCPGHDY